MTKLTTVLSCLALQLVMLSAPVAFSQAAPILVDDKGITQEFSDIMNTSTTQMDLMSSLLDECMEWYRINPKSTKYTRCIDRAMSLLDSMRPTTVHFKTYQQTHTLSAMKSS